MQIHVVPKFTFVLQLQRNQMHVSLVLLVVKAVATNYMQTRDVVHDIVGKEQLESLVIHEDIHWRLKVVSGQPAVCLFVKYTVLELASFTVS